MMPVPFPAMTPPPRASPPWPRALAPVVVPVPPIASFPEMVQLLMVLVPDSPPPPALPSVAAERTGAVAADRAVTRDRAGDDLPRSTENAAAGRFAAGY